jgi:hypothetical protein
MLSGPHAYSASVNSQQNLSEIFGWRFRLAASGIRVTARRPWVGRGGRLKG